MAALTANALLLTPRFVTALLWAEATVWLRLAWAGLWAMKDNGRWLRLTALAVFIVGSLLDLVGGWNA
jgi:phosphatidylglycerophosphate synthase